VLSVAELLDDPILSGAVCLAGGDGASRREVAWTSVIHWPAIDFIGRDELVLSTGVGCDGETLNEFVNTVIDSEAAALGLSFPPGAAGTALDPQLLTRADEVEFPILRIPWRIRFADIARRVTDAAIAERFSPNGPSEASGFLRTVLDGDGPLGLARSVEHAVGRGVVLFDDAFRVIAYGALANERVGEETMAASTARSVALSRDQVADLRGLLDFGGPRMLPGLATLGLPSGTGLAAVARRRAVGYVYVMDDPHATGGASLPMVELQTLEQAATALAVELVRQKAIMASDAHAAPEIMWDLATRSGASRGELLRRATALGFDVQARWEVALGTPAAREGEGEGGDAVAAAQAALSEFSERAHLTVAVRDAHVLVLRRADSAALRLAEWLDEHGTRLGLSWAIARESATLAHLGEAYDEVANLLDVGVRVLGPGSVAQADRLKPFMMLRAMLQDPLAREVAQETVGRLVEYDRRTGRAFIETYEAYVQEQFNTSAAARRLFLNRHSLLYRLSKIEELTGRSLDDPEDRFLLDLALKLVRLGALDPPADSAS
jgi:purine catabolism regulator